MAKIILIYKMVDTKITRYLDLNGVPYRILPHTNYGRDENIAL
ncbi:MAG: hypothetical protein WBL25_14155 [Anaerolineales bacterium]